MQSTWMDTYTSSQLSLHVLLQNTNTEKEGGRCMCQNVHFSVGFLLYSPFCDPCTMQVNFATHTHT